MRSARSALQAFGFKQTRRGALIIGLLVGVMMGVQGLAYAKAFPTESSRAALVASLTTVPGVNFFAGEPANAAHPDSYAIYKSIAMTTIIIAVWGLLVTTRLLRGFEENGQSEVLQVGVLSKRQVSGNLLIGFAYAFGLSSLLAFALIALLGAGPTVGLGTGEAALMTAATYLPGVFFAAVGALVSQLALTRGRAITYGLIPLLALYVIRGAANSASDIDWLKKVTPFGWSDLMNPVLGPKPLWVLPTIVVAVVCIWVALVATSKRDILSALIRQSDVARSHFHLLSSSLAFAIRRNGWTIFWWAFGTVFFAAFFAAVANLGSNLATDSPTFRHIFTSDTLNGFKLAFLGAGTSFAAVIMLIMTTTLFANVRREEAKLYLDNFLVQPVRRTTWLLGRLSIIIGSFAVITLLVGIVTWNIAHAEGITVDFVTCMQGQISLIGIVILVLGVGVLVYGLLPRLAVAAMSIVIGWAFIFDILTMLFHFNSWVAKTSVLTFIPSNPSVTPDWAAIAWLSGIGIALIVVGTVLFSKRDIITE